MLRNREKLDKLTKIIAVLMLFALVLGLFGYNLFA